MQSNNYTHRSPKELLANLATRKRYDTCFIIGGGPSLTRIIPDHTVLNDYDLICTNDAYKLYPNAMLLHFADKVWWGWHTQLKHNVKDSFHGEISTVTHARSHHLSHKETRVVAFTTGNKKGGINKDTNLLNGSCTGHQAINIAVHMGYKQIVLIGFDMKQERKTHWHSYHERQVNTDNFKKMLLPPFEFIPAAEKEMEFKVYNLNRDSAITCFSFADLEDFI